ncbi:EscJ/YscJ/HrcJ family type III secretion inner membrane ring protein [Chromobacterium phragmitis]|uniref:type III secretion system inner membrane ring lipoprotein SctJ n=1 Tax=Chromobacterium phragmitis TaxID=2202141 RepID=UPI000DECBCB5|nr:type III secretion inner membrane ring lipoprotein SctJ [Chromobacterium phragmitis]AXE30571.1 EscJ/YscJ/HrcJ family type III secretion inner membrane ring protein [Chromobacterium phragmitis]
MKPLGLLLVCALLLIGCKSELYSKLDEAEANQMLALLMYNRIPAEKRADKEGVGLFVDEDRFVDAVEVLRQNGLPRRKAVGMQDLFPSGQLVSSPEQEEAKLNYLKSQQLEQMLSRMDGVIVAEVTVAQPRARDGEEAPPASAAVFIKHSPEVNLPAREAEIRALVRDGIPRLPAERISLSLQRADYRYLPAQAQPAPSRLKTWLPWTAAGAALAVAAALALLWRRRRKEAA